MEPPWLHSTPRLSYLPFTVWVRGGSSIMGKCRKVFEKWYCLFPKSDKVLDNRKIELL